jgi:hypothetical protein
MLQYQVSLWDLILTKKEIKLGQLAKNKHIKKGEHLHKLLAFFILKMHLKKIV